ncbi:hypothetical protein GS498_20760 [Rhodococcus hoagii]|nr:hypothetical protein [Prescottella equi]
MTTADGTDATTPVSDVLEFVVGLSWSQVPVHVRRRLGMLTLDASAAARAGTLLSAAHIITDYVAAAMGGDEATCLLDGARVSASAPRARERHRDERRRLRRRPRSRQGHPGA